MNPLLEYFENNPGRLIHKWVHYFDIYHRHFSKFRNEPVTIVEFGVFHGGSLQMWKHYFGPRARIVGVDIDPACKVVEEDQIEVHIGDQEDGEFLTRLCDELGDIHIVIDDGGHTMTQQITTFEQVYPAVSERGVFLVEDLHTSYWPEYGGSYPPRRSILPSRAGPTFVEYSKKLIDQLNAWHAKDEAALPVTDFTRSAASMHFYDSVLVIEKGVVNRPYDLETGTPSFPREE